MTETDTLELQELRALAAYRTRQAGGEDTGVPHDEAYRRVFGERSDPGARVSNS